PRHRRAPAAPGRPHQAALQQPRDRLPRLDLADDLRRESRPPNPRQRVVEARPHAARLRRLEPRQVQRRDPSAVRHGAHHRTDRISIRAALTGHLVFSTLHTNDCPSTVARLLDMGIPAFLVASSLLLILAQRLGRKVCRQCREPYEADEGSLVPYGYVPTGKGKLQLYKGKGCAACNFTGMKGRIAIYEVMPVSEELRDAILKSAPTAELRSLAQAAGMRSLRQAGLMKVIEGTTTIDEVLRVTLS